MGRDKKTRGEDHRQTVRRPYHPPQLLIYGVLSDLAASGSGSFGENVVSKNKNKRL